MQPTHLKDTNTLLTYSLQTTPMPVQISASATNPSLANLTFVVSCPRAVGTANVAQFEIIVPVDDAGKPPDPTNLAQTPPPASAASISSSGSDQWKVSPGIAPGVFLFTPVSGTVQVSAQSLTIELTGIQINTLVGTALVRINEWAARGTGTPPPVTGPPSGAASFAVAKFPYGFYAGNLTADRPMIKNGQQPTLSWQGSANATYKMLYEDNPPLDVSNIRTWSPTSTPPSPVLNHMTTFILQVSAQQGGQTATVDFSITIEVDNPSLTATDLTVLTASNLVGAVHSGTLNVGGDATVSGAFSANHISTCWISIYGPSAGAALYVTNTNASTPVAYIGNQATNPSVTTGIQSAVATANDIGLSTNGIVRAASLNTTGDSSVGGGLSCNHMTTCWISIYGPSAGAALYVTNTNASTPVAYISNQATNPAGVTGIQAVVATPNDIGLWTNGRIVNEAGHAMMTHLPTALGNRVVTSPLSLEAEVHLSGKAKLSKGKADVKFDAGVSDLILHTPNNAYKVLLTPTQICRGLAVTTKSTSGFTVQELHDGTSNATFDWFVIASKPESLGATKPQKLPKKLPADFVPQNPPANMPLQLSKGGAAARAKTKPKPAAQKKKPGKR